MSDKEVRLNGYEIIHREAFCTANTCPACAILTLRQQVVSLTKQRDDLLDERDILQSELNGLVNDLKKIIGIVE